MEDKVFVSFVSFADFLYANKKNIPRAIHEACMTTAENILERTKEKFGHYQEEIGPFPAWEQLQDDTLQRREKRGINAENEPLLESGELRDSYQIAGSGNWGAVGSPLEKALAQEIGDPARNLPARPALGPAIYQWEQEHFELFEEMFMSWYLQGRTFKRLRTRSAFLVKSSGFGYGQGAMLDVSGDQPKVIYEHGEEEE